MAKTLFEKIIDGDLPGTIVYKDDLCFAIKDIKPTAPMHLLVIPRKVIAKLSEAAAEDQALLGHLMLVAGKVAAAEGFPAFRVVVNNGAEVGQSVFHLHLHVIGGRSMTWPPG